MQFIYSIASFIVALSILVIVHEFGHYWVARRMGIKVLRFSVGFGKALWSKKIGEDKTEWVVAAIPLGGYVKMLDETEGEVNPEEKHRAFNRQTLAKRSAVVVAGPMFNFVFAIVAYWILFVVGVNGLKPEIGTVSVDSYAEEMGFRAGDRLVEIDGMEVVTWGQHGLYLLKKTLSESKVVVSVADKVDRPREIEIDLSKLPIGNVIKGSVLGSGLGLYPKFPDILPIIGRVHEGPAMDAGIKEGDLVLEIQGKQILLWGDLVDTISKNPNTSLSIKIDRDGQVLKFNVVPKIVKEKGKDFGRIGVERMASEIPPEYQSRIQLNMLSAFKKSTEDTWTTSVVILQIFYRMLKLEVSSKNISGPITIAQYAGFSAKLGVETFVRFLAFVSISLGVLNLLPIPILDGGHLLYYSVELVKGSPVSEQVMIWGQQIGILLLAALMSLALYNDISRLFQ